MLAPAIVERICRLVDEGQLSQRKIATLMRVSRGTVGRIASGERPDYETMRQQRKDEQRDPQTGPLRRCDDCGAMVYLPCRACATRATMADKSAPQIFRLFMQLDEPVGLNLRGEDRTRYEEVRRQRELAQRDALLQTDPDDTDELDDDPYELTFTDLCDALEFDDEVPPIDKRDMPWCENRDERLMAELSC
ncbi:MAG: hypothetical protein V3R99_11110 [Thermoguttaceae bacterium]